jgi:hypothetical protein
VDFRHKGDILNIKVYEAVKNGKSDSNVNYSDFQNLIVDLGFEFRRQKGSHTMYYHVGIKEFINIQKDGSKAKAYQVEQLRSVIIKHSL